MKFSWIKAQLYALLIIALWCTSIMASLAIQRVHIIESLGFILINTFLCVGLFITAHDSMHGLISPNKTINNLFGKVSLYLYGAFSFKKLKENHMKHHLSPTSKTDPDYTKYESEGFFYWLYSFFREYYGPREYLLMHGHVLFFLWIADWNYFKVLTYYALPAILSALQLFYFGTYLPHRHKDRHNNRHFARSNNYPVWLSFLTCYHFGYHYEHHKYPDTPWWALPKRRSLRK